MTEPRTVTVSIDELVVGDVIWYQEKRFEITGIDTRPHVSVAIALKLGVLSLQTVESPVDHVTLIVTMGQLLEMVIQ